VLNVKVAEVIDRFVEEIFVINWITSWLKQIRWRSLIICPSPSIMIPPSWHSQHVGLLLEMSYALMKLLHRDLDLAITYKFRWCYSL